MQGKEGGTTGNGSTPVVLSAMPVSMRGPMRAVCSWSPFMLFTLDTGAYTCAHSLARWHRVGPRVTFCVPAAVLCWCHLECVYTSVRCGHLCMRVHILAASACAKALCALQCQVSPLPALHVGCLQTAPSTAPPPASNNPLSPLSPTGCKLSCHTKCQSKVRPVL